MTAEERAFAAAKVNLALHVTGRRADGYHLLDSIVAFADVGDRLHVARARVASLSVTGPEAATLPPASGNLVSRAAALIAADVPLAVTLVKELPSAAGIGGGSADAAAMLRAAARLLARTLPGSDALLPLGADVPVCLASEPARMSGIGEVLVPLPQMPALPAVLVNPRVPTPTGAVFRALDRFGPPLPPPPASPRREDWIAWLAGCRNDLARPAGRLTPAVREAAAALAALPGQQLVRMTGSGATHFALFPDRPSAEAAARRLASEYPGWWVRAATLGSAPADGQPARRGPCGQRAAR